MKKFPFNLDYVVLESVGTVIVPATGSTYPMNGPHQQEYAGVSSFEECTSVHVTNCSDEWYGNLEWHEREIVEVIKSKF